MLYKVRKISCVSTEKCQFSFAEFISVCCLVLLCTLLIILFTIGSKDYCEQKEDKILSDDDSDDNGKIEEKVEETDGGDNVKGNDVKDGVRVSHGIDGEVDLGKDRKECSENSGEIADRIDEEKFDETDREKVEANGQETMIKRKKEADKHKTGNGISDKKKTRKRKLIKDKVR